jgi:hypothetical protein
MTLLARHSIMLVVAVVVHIRLQPGWNSEDQAVGGNGGWQTQMVQRHRWSWRRWWRWFRCGYSLGAVTAATGVVIIKIPSTKTATFTGGVTETGTQHKLAGYNIYVVTATSTLHKR